MSQDPQQPPATGPQPAVPASTAGSGRRFLARFLDGLIVFIPVSLVLQFVGLQTPAGGLGGVDGWAWSAITGLLWFGYYVYFESHGGATLGKRLLSLKVVAADGRDPSPAAAAKRNVWMLFGLVPIIGGLAQLVAVIVIAITISSNQHHRGKHDEIAGTAVMA